MKIGYACVPIGIDARTTRSFVLRNFSEENFIKAVSENISDLMRILKYNLENKIYLFRISSDIIPFGGHEINNIKWWKLFSNELDEIGVFIKSNNLRVSMHPGQYTVLNSNKEEVVSKCITELEYHVRFLDSLKLDFTNKVVLHIGGVYGDKDSAKYRFINNWKGLSPSAKSRIVIENDEHSYTIEDILDICETISIPAVFDIFHHSCNPSLNNNLELILRKVSKTWNPADGSMKLHYSEEDWKKKSGAHSQSIDANKFLDFFERVKGYNPDIMLEVKDKDISAIRAIKLIKSI